MTLGDETSSEINEYLSGLNSSNAVKSLDIPQDIFDLIVSYITTDDSFLLSENIRYMFHKQSINEASLVFL